MNTIDQISARLAAACAACLIGAFAAPAVLAQTAPHQTPPAREDGRRGPPGMHGHGHGPLAALRGLDLSEAQQDRVFAILHEDAPRQRELDKKERQAREALRAMAGSPRFDQARAAQHAEALGQAVADEAMLRLKQDAALMAVLTPEQRATLAQRRAQPGQDRR